MRLLKSVATVALVGVMTLGGVNGLVSAEAVKTTTSTAGTTASVTLQLDKTSLSLYEGNSYKLKQKGTAKKVTWKSSDTRFVTVASNGKVKAKKAGKAVITATTGKIKAKCNVTVKKALTGSQLVQKFKKQMKADKCMMTVKASASSEGSSFSISMKMGYDKKAKINYVEMMGVKSYQKGNKTYTYDPNTKKWYYEITDSSSIDEDMNMDIPKKAKFKKLSNKAFRGQNCAVLQMENEGERVKIYFSLKNYQVLAITDDDSTITFDWNATITLPSAAKKAKKWSYEDYAVFQ